MNDWISTKHELPPLWEIVCTKIDDADGCRNVTKLQRGGQSGRLWFTPDGQMYVYYVPTHWRKLTE